MKTEYLLWQFRLAYYNFFLTLFFTKFLIWSKCVRAESITKLLSETGDSTTNTAWLPLESAAYLWAIESHYFSQIMLYYSEEPKRGKNPKLFLSDFSDILKKKIHWTPKTNPMIVLSSKRDNLRITTEKILLTTRLQKPYALYICVCECVCNENGYICIYVYINHALSYDSLHTHSNKVFQEMLLSWLGMLLLWSNNMTKNNLGRKVLFRF